MKKKIVYEYYHRFCNEIGFYQPKRHWHCCESEAPAYERTVKEWYSRDHEGNWQDEPYDTKEGNLIEL